jgi:ribosomal protein L24E
MKSLNQVCFQCHSEFLLPEKYKTIQNKKGRTHFFCSRNCSAKYGNLKTKRRPPKPQWGNQYGKKGEFTYYLNKAKSRKHTFDLDDVYLCSIWTGKCAITGISISKKTSKLRNTPITASLDRIDSKKGYVKGNVQFVAYSVNLAKSSFTNVEITEFFDSFKPK